MSSQLSMFGGAVPRFPRARCEDARSSHDAAAEVERTGIAARQAEQVLAAVRRWPNSSSHELAKVARLDRYAVARRLSELAATGLVVRRDPGPEAVPCAVSGKRVCRWELA